MPAAADWRARIVAVALVACGLAACEPVPAEVPRPARPEATTTPPSAAPPLSFQYREIRGGTLESTSLHGRISVIAFGTTYDVPSQAQVKFLAQVHRDHTPRINVALIVLEQPENEVLVAAFADALGLRFPVALADAATIRGEGPFSGLRHVPSVVILDREGRERTRNLGLMSNVEIEEALTKLEAELGPKR